MLRYLGINAEAIENQIEKCCDFLAEAVAFCNGTGFEDEADKINETRDFIENKILERIESNGGNWKNITDTIISAGFEITKETINECELFKNLEITVDGHIDGKDSELVVYSDVPFDNPYSKFDLAGATEEVIKAKYFEQVMGIVENYLNGTKTIAKEYIEDAFAEDMYKTAVTGELAENIKRIIDDFSEPVNKTKKSVERE